MDLAREPTTSFRGEQLEAASFIAPAGLALFALADGAWRAESGGYLWGVAVSPLVFGLVLLGVGPGVALRSPGQAQALVEGLDADPAPVLASELPRMRDVAVLFTRTVPTFGALASVGLVLYVAVAADRAHGLGTVLVATRTSRCSSRPRATTAHATSAAELGCRRCRTGLSNLLHPRAPGAAPRSGRGRCQGAGPTRAGWPCMNSFHLCALSHRTTRLFDDHREAAVLWSMVLGAIHQPVALCLMPDHVHVHHQRDVRSELAAAMRGYSRWRRRHRGESGPVWHPLERTERVADRSHFRRTVRYVHLNPCRKKPLVADPLAWPWSTHRDAVGLTLAPAVRRRNDPSSFHR